MKLNEWWLNELILNLYRSRKKEIGFRSGEIKSYWVIDPICQIRVRGKFVCDNFIITICFMLWYYIKCDYEITDNVWIVNTTIRMCSTMKSTSETSRLNLRNSLGCQWHVIKLLCWLRSMILALRVLVIPWFGYWPWYRFSRISYLDLA